MPLESLGPSELRKRGKRRVSFEPPHDAHENQKTTSFPTKMDKENQSSSNSNNVSSFRRSLQATMNSKTTTRTDKENVASSNGASRIQTGSSSILAPSWKANNSTQQQQPSSQQRHRPRLKSTGISAPAARRPVQPKTPNSMLRTELDFHVNNDESLLISPTNQTFAALSPLEMESLLEESPLTEEPKASFESSERFTGTTPYRMRGRGAQLNLSQDMFAAQEPAKKSTPSVSVALEPPSQQNVESSKHSDMDDTAPFACLDNTQQGIWLDFGSSNTVGSTHSKTFVLQGATLDDCIVLVERVAFAKGLNLIVDPDLPVVETTTTAVTTGAHEATRVRVGRRQKTVWTVQWTPLQEGGIREIILLKLPRGRLQITVRGQATVATRDTVKSHVAEPPLTESLSLAARPQSMLPIATETPSIQTTRKLRWTGATPATSQIPSPGTVYSKSSPGSRVTSAIATKKQITVHVDKDWAAKQCEAFANWLNYLFQPSEDKDHEASLLEVEQGGLATDQTALRALILHRRMAQVRGKAMGLFQEPKMRVAFRNMHIEISKGRLALRKDRDMYADLTQRGKITSLLLSYSTPWLRLGLETIFGEIISPETPDQLFPNKKLNALAQASSQKPGKKPNLSRMKLTLKKFIITRVLSDPDTLQKYTKGKCKVPSGNFEKKYLAEMRSFTLRRLLTLIIFLDKAKELNILDRVPRLFTKEATVKSSRDVLISLCRDFLSSEGDIIKHLSRIGINVTYKQESIDEIEFVIDNLATDLRDGVRLARMTEILTNAETKSMLKKLRLPAVSRLQKLHNVGSVLKVLSGYGVREIKGLASHHIVDGHREMVLKLMWAILSNCGLESILKPEQIQSEISIVLHANQRRQQKWKLANGTATLTESANSLGSSENEKEQLYKSLILEWANAVCACYGASVSNLNTAFADGTALCLLVHYYHPGLLALDSIQETTRHLSEHASSSERNQALVQERNNFEMACARMNDLGGIPRMLPVCDSQTVPEEKSMLLCLAYMCSRLMESSKEIMATIAIQQCFRRYHRRVELERKLLAASVIFRGWTLNKDRYYLNQRLKYLSPILAIEAFVLRFQHRLPELRAQRLTKERQFYAVTLLQSHFRRILAEKEILPLIIRNRAAVKLQSQWRRFYQEIQFDLMLVEVDAATLLQRTWRSSHGRRKYLQQKSAAFIIQRKVRSFLEQRSGKQIIRAAVNIQRIWRGFWAQLQYQVDMLDIVAVQSLARRRFALLELQRRRVAAAVLQRSGRRFLAVCKVAACRVREEEHNRLISLVLLCQRAVRKKQAIRRVRLVKATKFAAISIQKWWRGASARGDIESKHVAAVTIQTGFRGWKALQLRIILQTDLQELRSHQAAVLFQSTWRKQRQERRYRLLKMLATRLQARSRGQRVRSDLAAQASSAILIQSYWRSFLSRLHFQLDLLDVITVQSVVRRRLAMTRARSRSKSVILLQRNLRRWQAVLQVGHLLTLKVARDRERNAVFRIQGCVRRFLAEKRRKKFLLQVCSATKLQALSRQHLCRAAFLKAKYSAILIQSVARTHSAQRELLRRNFCAVTIQRAWRGFSSFVRYSLTLNDITLVQSLCRTYLARLQCERRKAAILCVQTHFRSILAKRIVSRMAKQRHERIEAEKILRRSSATLLQAVVRGHLIRQNQRYRIGSVVKIQKIVRGFLIQLNYQLDLIDVIMVQSVFRRWSAERQFESMKTAAIILQRRARIWHAEKLRREREEMYLRNYAARLIQKTWRCYDVHVDYMLIILSAIEIQSVVRRFLAVRKYRKTMNGIICFQNIALDWLARREEDRCMTTIQACARSFLAASLYQRKRSAAICIQSATRRFLARADLDLCHFAATEIQRIWRGYQMNTDFVIKIISAVTIQCSFRMFSAQCLASAERRRQLLEIVEHRFIEKQATRIQRAFRAHLCNKRLAETISVVQGAVRGFLIRRRLSRMTVSLVVLQSAIRGQLTRRRRSKKATVIARRAARATAGAQKDPSMRLGARTTAALLVLQNSTRLSEIMVAVTTLETCTRYSFECCIAFTECTATEILYSLIRTCNRSLPHIELLSHILLTFRNVVRYEVLLPRVSSSESAEVFMDLVQMFRDKENVFCSAVILLHRVLGSNPQLKVEFASYENIKRLKGVHSLCARKMSISSSSRQSLGGASTRKKDVRLLDWKRGVRTLKTLISLLEV